jgi:hypothetical protein
MRTGVINGSNQTYGIRESTERPEHLCANCKTPTGKSTIPCKNEPRARRR